MTTPIDSAGASHVYPRFASIRIAATLVFACLAVLSACASIPALRPAQESGPRFMPAADGVAPISEPISGPIAALTAVAGTGGIQLRVKWPGLSAVSAQTGHRTAQAIPLSAIRLDLSVLDASSSPVATASIVRPASEGSLQGIDVGTYTLDVAARRSDLTVVASGSATQQIVANRVQSISLTLSPANVPVLTSLSPSPVQVGDWVYLTGANLAPPPGGTYSVLVDDQPIPDADLQPGSSLVAFLAPAWLTTSSTVSVSVDGLPATTSLPIAKLTLDHLTITPATASLVVNQSQTFVYKAFTASGGDVSNKVAFAESLVNQDPPNGNGFVWFELNGGRLTASATGSVTVQIAAEGLVATASVVVVENTASPDPWQTPGPGPTATPPGGSGSPF